MPVPAVYIVATVALATVGAVVVFKELVYEPHIHPQVVRLFQEYKENRRRRHLSQLHAQHFRDDEDDATSPSKQPPPPRRRLPRQRQRTMADSNEEHFGVAEKRRDAGPMQQPSSDKQPPPLQDQGWWRRRPQMPTSYFKQPPVPGEPWHRQKGQRRPMGHSDDERYGIPDSHHATGVTREATLAQGHQQRSTRDIELADLAPEVREWRREDQSLRVRRNAGNSNALEESNHTIPFSPMLPTRTHVNPVPNVPISTAPAYSHAPATGQKASPVSAATPTCQSHNLANSPAMHVIGDPDSPTSTTASTPNGTPMSRRMQSLHELPAVVQDAQSSVLFSTDVNEEQGGMGSPVPTLSSLVTSPSLPTFPAIFNDPPAVDGMNPSPSSDSLGSVQMGGVPSSVGSTVTIISREQTPPTPPTPLSGGAAIPSLSQIYPQDLDYEHGVVLLSPPSSRSESPFSVVSGVTAGGRRSSPGYGSTTTNYVSLSQDGSRAPSSLARSPPRSRGSDGEDDEFDFDVVSSNASSSPLTISPFASPEMVQRSPNSRLGRTDWNDDGTTSPAVSTTSTMFSDLDLMDDDQDFGWI